MERCILQGDKRRVAVAGCPLAGGASSKVYEMAEMEGPNRRENCCLDSNDVRGNDRLYTHRILCCFGPPWTARVAQRSFARPAKPQWPHWCCTSIAPNNSQISSGPISDMEKDTHTTSCCLERQSANKAQLKTAGVGLLATEPSAGTYSFRDVLISLFSIHISFYGLATIGPPV